MGLGRLVTDGRGHVRGTREAHRAGQAATQGVGIWATQALLPSGSAITTYEGFHVDVQVLVTHSTQCSTPSSSW